MNYNNNIIQRGNCAWNGCKEHNCQVIRNQKGKLKNLPSCVNHKEFITKFHKIYKKIGEYYIDKDIKNLIDSRKIEVLKANYAVLMTELKQRLFFTENIKAEYRDEGHQFYMVILMKRARKIQKQIRALAPIEKN